eukprot:3129858-Amphidinium_carterae.1
MARASPSPAGRGLLSEGSSPATASSPARDHKTNRVADGKRDAGAELEALEAEQKLSAGCRRAMELVLK